MPEPAHGHASRETGHGLPAQIAADQPWDVGFATSMRSHATEQNC